LQIRTTLDVQRGYISIITASGEYYHGDSTRLTGKILRTVPSPEVFTSATVKHSDSDKSIYEHSNVLAKMGCVLLHSYEVSWDLMGTHPLKSEGVASEELGDRRGQTLLRSCSLAMQHNASTSVPLPMGQAGVLPCPLPPTPRWGHLAALLGLLSHC